MQKRGGSRRHRSCQSSVGVRRKTTVDMSSLLYKGYKIVFGFARFVRLQGFGRFLNVRVCFGRFYRSRVGLRGTGLEARLNAARV